MNVMCVEHCPGYKSEEYVDELQRSEAAEHTLEETETGTYEPSITSRGFVDITTIAMAATAPSSHVPYEDHERGPETKALPQTSLLAERSATGRHLPVPRSLKMGGRSVLLALQSLRMERRLHASGPLAPKCSFSQAAETMASIRQSHQLTRSSPPQRTSLFRRLPAVATQISGHWGGTGPFLYWHRGRLLLEECIETWPCLASNWPSSLVSTVFCNSIDLPVTPGCRKFDRIVSWRLVNRGGYC